ncbi:MAG: PH domain-containing protein [Microbacteriaceae bacterium]
MTGSREFFRSRFNRILAIVVWLACAAVCGLVLFTPGGTAFALSLVPVLAIAAVTWVIVWRPHVAVTDEGVHIANVTHSVDVPWAAVIHVDTKYSLTVHVPGRTFSAVSAPAPGRASATFARRSEGGRAATGESVRPGDLTSTDSGRAASLVRDRWQGLLDSGAVEAGLADEIPVRRRVDATAVAVLTLAVVASIASVAAPQLLG